jgi:hypothetical protein
MRFTNHGFLERLNRDTFCIFFMSLFTAMGIGCRRLFLPPSWTPPVAV